MSYLNFHAQTGQNDNYMYQIKTLSNETFLVILKNTVSNNEQITIFNDPHVFVLFLVVKNEVWIVVVQNISSDAIDWESPQQRPHSSL